MYFLLPLLLLFTSLLTSNLPIVAADCFSSGNYDNCATCYQTFANALINTSDNKYNLSKAFFPTHKAISVHVRVEYIRVSNTSDSKTYFWIMGGFYLIQPLDVFLYRSLFFSPPSYRQESVTVTLPDECFTNDTMTDFTKKTNEEFFQYATQRVSIYYYTLLHFSLKHFLHS